MYNTILRTPEPYPSTGYTSHRAKSLINQRRAFDVQHHCGLKATTTHGVAQRGQVPTLTLRSRAKAPALGH
jgi:hypothetical protein